LIRCMTVMGRLPGAVPYLMCKHVGYEEDSWSVKTIRAAEWSRDGDKMTLTNAGGLRFVLSPAGGREVEVEAWRKRAGDTSKVDAFLLNEHKNMAAGWAQKTDDSDDEEFEDELPSTVDP